MTAFCLSLKKVMSTPEGDARFPNAHEGERSSPFRCAIAVVLAVICLSLFPGCTSMDRAGPAVFIPPAASESTAEIPTTAAEPTASAKLPVTGGATTKAASSRKHATPSTPHNESAGATAPAHDPAYVMDGVCKPLVQNGPPQTLTLAISLYMDANDIWTYVKTIETECNTARRMGDGRIVQTGTLKNYDPQFVQLKADIDCGDPAVLKCTLQSGRTEIVDVTDSQTVPMLWRWNVQAGKAHPLGEQRGVSIHVSGARKDGKFKPVDTIPDRPIPIDIDSLGILDLSKRFLTEFKEVLIAIAGIVTLIAGWIKFARRRRNQV